jgi:hypothetical protein
VLEVRNMVFPIDETVPKYWHGGRRSVSIFFDNLSIFFPAGERFFIASLRAQRHRVSDPQLLRDIALFSAQEGMHGREHTKYNENLHAHGYPVRAMEKRVQRILRVVSRTLPKRFQLAITCALEHFTAMMAHFILSDPALLEGAHPAMAALWRWHAAEENEHKAVAFDVYRAAGGGELERMGIMAATTVIFWAKVLEQQVRLMASDGCLFSAREWWALVRFLCIEPGGMLGLGRAYLDYYRPGFHPWDLDNRDLLERWKEESYGASHAAL